MGWRAWTGGPLLANESIHSANYPPDAAALDDMGYRGARELVERAPIRPPPPIQPPAIDAGETGAATKLALGLVLMDGTTSPITVRFGLVHRGFAFLTAKRAV